MVALQKNHNSDDHNSLYERLLTYAGRINPQIYN